MNDDAALEVRAYSFGIGAAMNCDFSNINVEPLLLVDTDGAGLHRSKDAGAGAMSPYHNRITKALKRIEPGEELFANYGVAYFETREETYGAVPLPDDYKEADKVLRKFLKVAKEHNLPLVPPPDSEWDQSSTEDKMKLIQATNMFIKLVSDFQSIWGSTSRALNAFPIGNTDHNDGMSDLENLVQHLLLEQQQASNSTSSSNDDDILVGLVRKKRKYSLEWLEEHGSCMDNIRAGPSTNPQAGRGAFATRSIPAGSVVAPAPLIHVHDRSVLVMYRELSSNDGSEKYVPVHHQLILNYCFGHSDTTVLLCPYGVRTGFINHAPASSGRVNARIVWNKKLSRHTDWFGQHPDDWAKGFHAGLVLNFVATRDIEPNEEIFIDYGDEWEAAWQSHLKNYNDIRHKLSEDYKPGYEMVSEEVDLLRLNENKHYRNGSMELYCRESYLGMAGLKHEGGEGSLCRAVYGVNSAGAIINTRKDKPQHYIAEIFGKRNDKELSMTFLELRSVFFGAPAKAFYFQDKPYTRDHVQTWAFRHDMNIPDDIMPDAWRNVPMGNISSRDAWRKSNETDDENYLG